MTTHQPLFLDAHNDAPATSVRGELVAIAQSRVSDDVWGTYPVQIDAMEFPSTASRLPCFAKDLPPQGGAECRRGRKEYTRTSYQRFYRRCRAQPPEQRCWYELLLDDVWCNLYLDIDLCTKTNPEHDGDALCARLRQHLVTFLGASYPDVVRSRDDVRFIELDSSYEDKFSRHVVVRVRDACFVNLKHCGAFMRRFHIYLVEQEGAVERNPFFAWRADRRPDVVPSLDALGDAMHSIKTRPDIVSVIDMCVYTTNRVFRCRGSHKYTDDPFHRKLWLCSERAERQRSGDINDLDIEQTLDSMIQYFDPEHLPAHALSSLEWDGREPTSTNSPWAHLYRDDDVRRLRRLGSTATTSSSSPAGPALAHDDFSALPPAIAVDGELEAKLMEMVRREYPGSPVMTPQYSCESGTVTVPLREHMCAIAGREHRSNHIYVVVNLLRGQWRQKCHGCPDEATPSRALPAPLAKRCVEFLKRDRERVKIDVSAMFTFLE